MRILTALAALVCLLLPVVSAHAAEPLRVLIWSDYIDPTIPAAFEKKTGIPVRLDLYEETEAMIAKLQVAGGDRQYDVVIASDHAVRVLTKLGLLQKLDLARIPNAHNIMPQFLNPPYDPQGQYSLPYQWGTMGLIYNRTKYPNLKASWSSAFVPALQPQRMVLLDSMRDLLGAALLAGGHDINSQSPAELKAAGRLLIAAKNSPRCLGFDGSPAACKKVVAGQADLAIVYNGDALNAIREAAAEPASGPRPTYDYVIPAEGSIIWVDTMVVPAHAPHAAAAWQFINYILDPQVGATLSNYIHYATPNTASLPLVKASERSDPRIYPPAEQIKNLHYLRDVGSASQLYDEVWTAMKSH